MSVPSSELRVRGRGGSQFGRLERKPGARVYSTLWSRASYLSYLALALNLQSVISSPYPEYPICLCHILAGTSYLSSPACPCIFPALIRNFLAVIFYPHHKSPICQIRSFLEPPICHILPSSVTSSRSYSALTRTSNLLYSIFTLNLPSVKYWPLSGNFYPTYPALILNLLSVKSCPHPEHPICYIFHHPEPSICHHPEPPLGHSLPSSGTYLLSLKPSLGTSYMSLRTSHPRLRNQPEPLSLHLLLILYIHGFGCHLDQSLISPCSHV